MIFFARVARFFRFFRPQPPSSLFPVGVSPPTVVMLT